MDLNIGVPNLPISTPQKPSKLRSHDVTMQAGMV